MNVYDSSHRTLEGRTEKLMNQLLAIGIGDRPIIFLAHSMGGLLVKNMIVAGKLLHRCIQNSKFYKYNYFSTQ